MQAGLLSLPQSQKKNIASSNPASWHTVRDQKCTVPLGCTKVLIERGMKREAESLELPRTMRITLGLDREKDRGSGEDSRGWEDVP